MINRPTRTNYLIVGILFCAACSEGDDAPLVVVQGAALPRDAAPACAPEPCTCGSASGVRRCDDAGPGTCECAPVIMPAPPLTDTSGDCLAGLYLGNFEGAAGFVFPTTPVTGADVLAGMAIPLEINLERTSLGAEFAIVGNGVMRGNANGTFPFEATIMGELDCSAKRFTAEISGSVQLFVDGVRNAFTGTMIANYDGKTHQLIDGTWTVTGSNADGGLDFALTGEGMWQADHAGDAGVDGGLGLDAGAGDGGP